MDINNINNDSTQAKRWEACLRIIQSNLDAQQYATWFEPIAFDSFDEQSNELKVRVPSPFVYEYIESHFLSLLRAVLKRVYGERIRLVYNITTDATNNLSLDLEASNRSTRVQQPASQVALNQSPRPLQELDSQLKPEYTFDNFVEGSTNKLPRTVGLAIAENPRQATFNPLFIYGPSGCGKTHLVNAIGTRLKELHPQMRVLYVSAHLFQVQYTDSVRKNTVNDFISFYQTIDALIIDDIQEFASLHKTQLAFFHIFNHLHQNGRQLILTSDRPPIELQGMEERLLTRFKWGLLAELERPNEELRRNILRSKIHHDGLRISEPVINYIASVVSHSVRDLEGVINSLMAYSVVYNCDIDLQMAERVITRTIGTARATTPAEVTIDTIIDCTCQAFDVDRKELLSKSRKANIALSRQVAMYLAQKHTRLSTTKIGFAIGRRNHATVIHACQNISARLQSEEQLRQQVADLEQQLTSSVAY